MLTMATRIMSEICAQIYIVVTGVGASAQWSSVFRTVDVLTPCALSYLRSDATQLSPTDNNSFRCVRLEF